MGKIKLDLEPNDSLDFERSVAIPEANPKKEPLRIKFKFKWRDRNEAAALFDAYIEKGRAERQAEDERIDAGGTPRTMAEIHREGIARDVEMLKDFATGWNIDAPFDDVHLTKFFTKYSGAGMAIASDYRVSLFEGRLGN